MQIGEVRQSNPEGFNFLFTVTGLVNQLNDSQTDITDSPETAYWFEWCPSPSGFYCVDDTGTLLLPEKTCEKSTEHRCQCPDGQEFDIIIDGDSVKLGPKQFTDSEIERLQTLNGADS